jgi:transcriptional regulator with XRE-family HTH domain
VRQYERSRGDANKIFAIGGSSRYGGRVETSAPQLDDVSDADRIARLVRTARKGRGLTLRALAAKAGVSASMLSHIENQRVSPSLTTLRSLARALDLPVAELFVDGRDAAAAPATAGASPALGVVRRGHRKHLHLPTEGLRYELLSPNLRGAIEFLWSEFEPLQPDGPPGTHPGEEAIVVLEGALDVHVADESVRLEAGDSITFDSSLPHRVQNPGPGRNVCVTAITPPAF